MVGGWEWHQPRRRTPAAAASAALVPPDRTAATAATGVGRRDQAATAADGWESDVEEEVMAPSHLRAGGGGGAPAHRAGNAAARGKYNSSRKHYSNQKYHSNHYNNYHRPSQQEQPVQQDSAAAATAATTAAADDDDGNGDGNGDGNDGDDDGGDETEDIDEYINRSTSGKDSGSDENGSDEENIFVEFTVVQAPFSLLDLLQACAGEDDEEATTLIASAAATRGGGDGGAHRRVIGWSGEEADEEDDEDDEDTDSSQYLSHQQQHYCKDHDHDRKHNHNHHHHYHHNHNSSAGEPRGYFNASHFFAPANGHYQHPAVTELVDSDEEEEKEVTGTEEEEAAAAEEEEHHLQHQSQLDPWEVSPPTPHSATSSAPLISHAEPSPPTPLSPRPPGRVFEIFDDDDDDDDILAEDEHDEHDEHDGQVEAEQEQEQEQQERRRRHQQQQTRAHHLLRPPPILTTAAAGTDTHQHPRPISLLPSQRHRRAAVDTAGPPVPTPTMSQFPPPSRRPSSPTSVRFNEPLPQMQSSAVRAATKIGAMRRERALSAGRITPGVDDTPHIQYALAALTRDSDRENAESAAPAGNDGVGGAEAGPSHTTAATAATAEAGIGDAPDQRRHQPRQQQQQPPHPQQQQQQPTQQQPRLDNVHREWRPSTAPHHPHRQQPRPVEPNSPEREERIRNLFRQNSEGADSSRHPGHGHGAGVGAHHPHHHNFGVDRLISVTELDLFATDPNRQKYPRLDRKPRILHTSWLLTLMGLIFLIVGALVTAVVLSGSRPTGLAPYSGSIYSMQFFLFRILPQAAAATVFMFAQSVTVASFRAAPFAAMAEEDAYRRFGALFVTMYPPSFLWPHLAGPWELKAGALAGWPLLITLPLASASFSVVYVDGQWYWSAVRAVVWTLVALYFVYLAGLAVVLMFWHDRVTGLMWDVRSLADLVPLISQQPPCDDYAGTQGLARRRQIMTHLHHKFVDRLGYWTRAGRSGGGGGGGDDGGGPVERRPGAQGGGDVFYGMGKPWAAREVRRSAFGTILGRRVSFGRDLDPDELDQPTSANAVRYRYLPWCLRSGPLIISTVVAAALMLALIVVSFRPGTSLALGFPPEVPAGPRAGAFSAANFLWSFVPALVGTILMAAFQTLDLRLRILKPWAELARVGGGTARESLLLDYAACLPFEAALKAASNRHWRVAFVSLVGGLSVFVPVLAGGVFMALTVDGAGGEVRMFANMAVFGVLISLLVLYLVGLMTLIPFRIQFALPHPVDCPAEVISFLADPKLLADPAFDGPRSRADLLGRLDGRAVVPRRGHGDDDQTRWVFEVDGGNTNPRGRLGVRRAAEKGWVV